MYKTLSKNGVNYLSTGAGFLPSTVVEPNWIEMSESKIFCDRIKGIRLNGTSSEHEFIKENLQGDKS